MFQIFHDFAQQNTKFLCFSVYYVIYSWSEILKQLPQFISLQWIKQS